MASKVPAFKAADLSDNQRILQKALDQASYSCIAYAASEVPALENLTPEGLMDELGYLNEARKAMEKTEAIVKERLRSQLTPAQLKEFRGENFYLTTRVAERSALNQSAAKAYFTEHGILDQYMAITEVPTTTVKRIGK